MFAELHCLSHFSFQRGASSPADAFQRHKGQEFGYVLSGTLRLNIGFDEL